MAFELTSKAFSSGSPIPRVHTCDGQDVSPELTWTDPPAGAKSLALICDDPDAPVGTWVHWVLWGIGPETRTLPEGLGKKVSLSKGCLEGITDFGRTGYGGPCPPRGKPHRYFFKLYALDMVPSLSPKARKSDLLEAIRGHVLDETKLMGTYKR
ncbi:MAG: YbhB/YbcL family Raf kinase inhibitor-like protein [Deltaproteobacteria bacterium]|nr:YbhB/YbcL family Raf kinase inhibitor-like protein [Deltaproteobacteria bacterium]